MVSTTIMKASTDVVDTDFNSTDLDLLSKTNSKPAKNIHTETPAEKHVPLVQEKIELALGDHDPFDFL